MKNEKIKKNSMETKKMRNYKKFQNKKPKTSPLLKLFSKKNIFIKLLVLTLILFSTMTIFSFFKKSKMKETLPTNANFLNYEIKNKNRAQIEELLNNEINPKIANLSAILNFDDKQLKIDAKDYDFKIDLENFFKAAKQTNYEKKEKLKPKLTYNEKKLNKTLENFSNTYKILPAPYSYRRNNENLFVSAGHDGKIFDVNRNKNKIIEAFSNLEEGEIDADFKLINGENKKINFTKIKNEIDCEPQNACYKTDPSTGKTKIEKEKEGLLLNSSEKDKIDDPNQGTYKLKVQIIKPKITVDIFRERAKNDPSLKDTLVSFSTLMSAGKDKNAIHNIKTASKAIDGIVLLPGDEFSFLKAIRTRSKQSEYKDAIAFNSSAPGGECREKGGGMCQVSSTIFNAAIHANLEITARSNHTFRVTYVPIGTDATVSDGSKDLRFRNNRKNPIKIHASASNSKVTVSIIGKKLPEEVYDVTFDSKITAETDTYVNAIATQTVKQNGAIIKQVTYRSHYLVREKDIKRAISAQQAQAKKAAEEEAKKIAEEEAKKAEEAKKTAEEEAKKANETKNNSLENVDKQQNTKPDKTNLKLPEPESPKETTSSTSKTSNQPATSQTPPKTSDDNSQKLKSNTKTENDSSEQNNNKQANDSLSSNHLQNNDQASETVKNSNYDKTNSEKLINNPIAIVQQNQLNTPLRTY